MNRYVSLPLPLHSHIISRSEDMGTGLSVFPLAGWFAHLDRGLGESKSHLPRGSLLFFHLPSVLYNTRQVNSIDSQAESEQ